jgi:hypothetical protein
MTKIASLVILFVTILVCLLPAVPAQAQAARTFVSAAGSDSNSCTNVATPCRHFAAAYAATAPNGEIDVLDPANYGQLTITGPVSIEGHGWAAVTPLLGGSGIAINVGGNPGDKINISGVVLQGSPGGNTGINCGGGVSLTIRDSVIQNFGAGIILQPNNSSTLTQLFVSNTLVSDNVGDGVFINPNGSGTTNAIFDHVELENNGVGGLGGSGLRVAATSQTVNIAFTDSVIANNTIGIYAFVSTVPLSIMVRDSTIANNSTYGLEAGSNTTIRVTRSTITGNGTAWLTDFGAVLSYGDNNIDGNTNANTEPPNPLTYK